ncbi:hypothetical protein H9P43_002262 [Blastocladiella emersonii ATCC 22665]|nr:hypothetical protein H9P43_002262 [Blastocladiella emersonii ATCC 22665]
MDYSAFCDMLGLAAPGLPAPAQPFLGLPAPAQPLAPLALDDALRELDDLLASPMPPTTPMPNIRDGLGTNSRSAPTSAPVSALTVSHPSSHPSSLGSRGIAPAPEALSASSPGSQPAGASPTHSLAADGHDTSISMTATQSSIPDSRKFDASTASYASGVGQASPAPAPGDLAVQASLGFGPASLVRAVPVLALSDPIAPVVVPVPIVHDHVLHADEVLHSTYQCIICQFYFLYLRYLHDLVYPSSPQLAYQLMDMVMPTTVSQILLEIRNLSARGLPTMADYLLVAGLLTVADYARVADLPSPTAAHLRAAGLPSPTPAQLLAAGLPSPLINGLPSTVPLSLTPSANHSLAVGLPSPSHSADLPSPSHSADLPSPSHSADLPSYSYSASLPSPSPSHSADPLHAAGGPSPSPTAATLLVANQSSPSPNATNLANLEHQDGDAAEKWGMMGKLPAGYDVALDKQVHYESSFEFCATTDKYGEDVAYKHKGHFMIVPPPLDVTDPATELVLWVAMDPNKPVDLHPTLHHGSPADGLATSRNCYVKLGCNFNSYERASPRIEIEGTAISNGSKTMGTFEVQMMSARGSRARTHNKGKGKDKDTDKDKDKKVAKLTSLDGPMLTKPAPCSMVGKAKAQPLRKAYFKFNVKTKQLIERQIFDTQTPTPDAHA